VSTKKPIPKPKNPKNKPKVSKLSKTSKKSAKILQKKPSFFHRSRFSLPASVTTHIPILCHWSKKGFLALAFCALLFSLPFLRSGTNPKIISCPPKNPTLSIDSSTPHIIYEKSKQLPKNHKSHTTLPKTSEIKQTAPKTVIYAPPHQKKQTITANKQANRPLPAPTWQANKVAFTPKTTYPKIALVLDDMGNNTNRLTQLINLPAPLSLSFLPYIENLQHQINRARNHGHEIFLHVPMQSSHPKYTEPHMLRVGMSDRDVRHHLEWSLRQCTGYVGINNHMGGLFTTKTREMSTVMTILQEKGLAFLDSRTSAQSVGTPLARQYGLPHAQRHVFLDHDPTLKNVQAQLIKTVEHSRRNGRAIAIGHPKTNTIKAIKDFLLNSPIDYELVPLSYLLWSNK
jgi:polysaccharide deacetylase 2 family uncharacterized protein YibQ